MWELKCKKDIFLEGFSTPDFKVGKIYRVKSKFGDDWEIVGEFGLYWINKEKRAEFFEME